MTLVTGSDKSLSHSKNKAFTLLEIILVLSIVLLIFGLSVPFMGSALKVQSFRNTVNNLQTFAKTCRGNAMKEQRVWLIQFEPDTFSYSPVNAAQDKTEYQLPKGMSYQIARLPDMKWKNPQYEKWSFQPNGLCEPIKLRFEKDNNWMEIQFDPLTAEIREETFHIQ